LTTLKETQLRQIFEDIDQDHEGRLKFQHFFQFFSNLIQGKDPDILKVSQQAPRHIAAAQVAGVSYTPLANPTAQAKFALFVALLKAEREGKCSLGGVTQFINKQWSTFNNFLRYGSRGDIVMEIGTNIDDILPGDYLLTDLIKWPDSLTDTIEPRCVKVKGKAVDTIQLKLC
ncbi:unnamed protein product, partial [Didymodactylos carnosus]